MLVYSVGFIFYFSSKSCYFQLIWLFVLDRILTFVCTVTFCLFRSFYSYLINLEGNVNYSILADGRVKMPLSPTAQEIPYGFARGLSSSSSSSSIQLIESSLYPSTSSVSHSYSSNNLGQMQFDGSTMGSFRSPHRSQMHLQSRRSQSREDLNSSLAEAHMVKV